MRLNIDTVIVVISFVLGILCVAAGVPKILQMPQELNFLGAVGLPAVGVSVVGVLQVAGGAMLFWKKSRLAGAVIAGLTLLLSSIALIVGGNMPFGLISLLPVAVAVVVLVHSYKRTQRGIA